MLVNLMMEIKALMLKVTLMSHQTILDLEKVKYQQTLIEEVL
jgi:hypothetical protein